MLCSFFLFTFFGEVKKKVSAPIAIEAKMVPMVLDRDILLLNRQRDNEKGCLSVR